LQIFLVWSWQLVMIRRHSPFL